LTGNYDYEEVKKDMQEYEQEPTDEQVWEVICEYAGAEYEETKQSIMEELEKE
jgi:hypothetical protein